MAQLADAMFYVGRDESKGGHGGTTPYLFHIESEMI